MIYNIEKFVFGSVLYFDKISYEVTGIIIHPKIIKILVYLPFIY